MLVGRAPVRDRINVEASGTISAEIGCITLFKVSRVCPTLTPARPLTLQTIQLQLRNFPVWLWQPDLRLTSGSTPTLLSICFHSVCQRNRHDYLSTLNIIVAFIFNFCSMCPIPRSISHTRLEQNYSMVTTGSSTLKFLRESSFILSIWNPPVAEAFFVWAWKSFSL